MSELPTTKPKLPPQPDQIFGPAKLPLKIDDQVNTFTLHCYQFGSKRWVSAHLGDLKANTAVPLRIESACVFGHIFHSQQCDCGFQLDEALRRISALGNGLVLYGLDDDARGLGVAAHFQIYAYRQRDNLDTPEVYKRLNARLDSRDYAPVISILEHLGIREVRLLSNNTERRDFLRAHNIVVHPEAIEAPMTRYNMATLMLEKEDLGYTWSFKTHAEWLERLQGKVKANPNMQGCLLVKNTHELVAEVYTEDWDLASKLFESLGSDFKPSSDLVLYLSDFPRLDEVARYQALGTKFLVLPFPTIPTWLSEAALRYDMKAQDWGRRNRYTVARPQWVPIAATSEGDLYQRGSVTRMYYRTERNGRPRWEQQPFPAHAQGA